VEFEFDPKVTSYEKLLETFWAHHDPCTLAPNTDEKHRTTQYMSLLLYHTPQQKVAIENSLKAEQAKRADKIVTKVLDAKAYPLILGEDYHQKYLLQQHPIVLKSLELKPGPALNNSFVCARLNGYLGGYGTLDEFQKEMRVLALPAELIVYMLGLFNQGIKVNKDKMIDDFFEERNKTLKIKREATCRGCKIKT
jgi:peptide-methionine (S)-S-oxide reductase